MNEVIITDKSPHHPHNNSHNDYNCENKVIVYLLVSNEKMSIIPKMKKLFNHSMFHFESLTIPPAAFISFAMSVLPFDKVPVIQKVLPVSAPSTGAAMTFK